MVVYVCVELWVYTLSLWCSNANQQTSLFIGLCVASKGSLPPYKPTSVGRTSGYSIPRPHAAYSNLPAFLVKEGGLNSGFMLAHCTAAALGECCVSHFKCIDTHTRTHTRAHTHTHIHIHTHTHVHTHIHIHTCTRTHTHTHAHMHTHTHTHMHTHMHTYRYCSHYDQFTLLHELILAIGYFCVLNAENQVCSQLAPTRLSSTPLSSTTLPSCIYYINTGTTTH